MPSGGVVPVEEARGGRGHEINSNSKIEEWKEKEREGHKPSIPRSDIPVWLQSLKRTIKIPPHIEEQFIQQIMNLTNTCGAKGATSTLSGDLDGKSAIFGIFHCAENPNQGDNIPKENKTLSVYYVFNMLSVEQERKSIVPNFNAIDGIQEADRVGVRGTQFYLARRMAERLEMLGVNDPAVKKFIAEASNHPAAEGAGSGGYRNFLGYLWPGAGKSAKASGGVAPGREARGGRGGKTMVQGSSYQTSTAVSIGIRRILINV